MLRNIDNLREAVGPENVQIELIAHSGGLGMVLKSNQETRDKVRQLAREEWITFLACENTMAREGFTVDDLIAGVETVDAGVAQVVRRQAEGWQYIRSGE